MPEREERLQEENKLARFEQTVMPHLDAAYNLARWLVRNNADAEDVVQEATLRAFKFFGGFHGRDARAWLLTIVRNTCYTWMQQNRAQQLTDSLDEEAHQVADESLNPEALLLENLNVELLRQAMEELPLEFREVMVLRELEELSYKEIASIVDLPLGTVMSRLSRARKRLQQTLASRIRTEV